MGIRGCLFHNPLHPFPTNTNLQEVAATSAVAIATATHAAFPLVCAVPLLAAGGARGDGEPGAAAHVANALTRESTFSTAVPKLATIPAPRARCACLARGPDAALPWPLSSQLVALFYPLPWRVRAYPLLSH